MLPSGLQRIFPPGARSDPDSGREVGDCRPAYARVRFSGGGRQRAHCFLLESVERGEQIGRYTFLGARPYMQVRARGRRNHYCTQASGGNAEPATCSQSLKTLLRAHRPAHIAGLPPFTAGAVGYFAYDAVRRLEKIGDHAKDDLSVPDCVLMFFDRLLAFDHLRHQIHIIANADVSARQPASVLTIAP